MIYRILFLSSLCVSGMASAMYQSTVLSKAYTPLSKHNLSSYTLPIVQAVDKSMLHYKDFQVLASYTRDFLQNNMNKLACEKNESGFLRINVPIQNHLSNKIEKVRVNYWPSDAAFKINPESVHSHPRYFESFIVQGSYSHALFSLEQEEGNNYAQYRLFKNGGDKNFAFMGLSKLKDVTEVEVEPRTIISFPKNLIHQVVKTSPLTLTINAVFKGTDLSDNYYDVYISPKGTFTDVKVERKMLFTNESLKYTKEIISSLKNFEAQHTA